MKLNRFRVWNYRPILDSGWVDLEDITVIIGKNESGKTAVLKALHKFNPFMPEPYALEREWPRGHRKMRSPDAVVVQTQFTFLDREAADIKALWPSQPTLATGVEIAKTYKGDFKFKFTPVDLPAQADVRDITEAIKNRIKPNDDAPSEELKTAIEAVRDEAVNAVETSGVVVIQRKLDGWRAKLDQALQVSQPADDPECQRIKGELEAIVASIDLVAARKQLEEKVQGWIPRFIYMDDHKPFSGMAYLDQIKQRKNNNQLTHEDQTFLMILEMAALDFEQEVTRANTEDKEQRMLDMNDASLTLNNLLADHWSQRKYRVRFEADGNNVIAFVSDEIQPALVPLNERSKGFQWFFSFDTTFLYETDGTFKNAIILLDEPGLHLHIDAQRDLLKRLREYAKGNQLIYTTHMPFMIDMERLDTLRFCIENKELGSRVTTDFEAADQPTRFPIQAHLGMAMSQSLFVGPFNLVVEGITDFWLLSTMASILRDGGIASLDERIVITPAGGATKAAYVGTMLQGQQLQVLVLLDSDPEGQRTAKGLINDWIIKARHILLLGDLIARKEHTTLEDLFPVDFYLEYVNRAYAAEFGTKPLMALEVNATQSPMVVNRIDAAMKSRGLPVNSEGMAFNKGRPAKLLLNELPKKALADLPHPLVDTFGTIFAKVNEMMPGLILPSKQAEGKR
jgi:predicted ATP-dependent endonuclease of OLD family